MNDANSTGVCGRESFVVTFDCPHCGCVATEVTAKGGQLTYRGCGCIKFESLDGVLGLAEKPRSSAISPASASAVDSAKCTPNT